MRRRCRLASKVYRMRSTDINTRFCIRYGCKRWHAVLMTLGWQTNIINGSRVYITAFADPAQGKYFVSPADADDLIHVMCDELLLKPLAFRPDPKRLPAIGLIGYNPQHIDTLRESPVAGHYIDWDYEVMMYIQPALQQIHAMESLYV